MRFSPKFVLISRLLGTLLFFLGLSIFWTSSAAAQSLIRDAELENFLDDLIDPVIVAAHLEPDAVQYYVINDQTLNAFVSGGQNIFFHTGLIVAADTPNELLGVAAHETGHIAGGHLARFSDGVGAASVPIYVGLGLGILAIAAGNPDAGMAFIAGGQHVGTMNFLSYSRAQEAAADQAAVTYLERAGDSPDGLMDFFENFREIDVVSGAERYKYWRTHPLSSDRISALRQRVEESPYRGDRDNAEMNYRFQMIKAKLYGFIDRPEAALRRFPSSDQSDPAHYGRAVAYFRMSNVPKAVDEVDQLIKKHPDNPYYYELKGQILFESGKIEEALPFIRKSVQLAPGEALLRLNLGQALVALPGSEKDPAITKEAQKHLRKAIAFEKDLIFAYHQLAITYDRQGDAGMADLMTAERYYHMGDLQGAGNFAARAKDKLPENSVHWNRAMDILQVVKLQRDKGHR
ncbi:MAG: M48 family peptidase [Alphaproteobacteria bacterium]|nr:MAG: M48 family peptidase [Alphaproteobacteria bacterium]